MIRWLAKQLMSRHAEVALALLSYPQDWEVQREDDMLVARATLTHSCGAKIRAVSSLQYSSISLNGEVLGFWDERIIRPSVIAIIEQKRLANLAEAHAKMCDAYYKALSAKKRAQKLQA